MTMTGVPKGDLSRFFEQQSAQPALSIKGPFNGLGLLGDPDAVHAMLLHAETLENSGAQGASHLLAQVGLQKTAAIEEGEQKKNRDLQIAVMLDTQRTLVEQGRKAFSDMLDRLNKQIDRSARLLDWIQQRQKNMSDMLDYYRENPDQLQEDLQSPTHERLKNGGLTDRDIAIMKEMSENERMDYMQGKEDRLGKAEEKVKENHESMLSWQEALEYEKKNFDGKLQHPKLRKAAEDAGLDPDNMPENSINTIETNLYRTEFVDAQTILKNETGIDSSSHPELDFLDKPVDQGVSESIDMPAINMIPKSQF